MIKAVVFDFDGTLADTIPLIVSEIEQLAEKELHRKYTPQDFIRLRDKSSPE